MFATDKATRQKLNLQKTKSHGLLKTVKRHKALQTPTPRLLSIQVKTSHVSLLLDITGIHTIKIHFFLLAGSSESTCSVQSESEEGSPGRKSLYSPPLGFVYLMFVSSLKA